MSEKIENGRQNEFNIMSVEAAVHHEKKSGREAAYNKQWLDMLDLVDNMPLGGAE